MSGGVGGGGTILTVFASFQYMYFLFLFNDILSMYIFLIL